MNTVCFVNVVAVDVQFFVLSVFEELNCSLQELCVGQYILFLLYVLSALFCDLVQLGLQQVCRSAGDGFLVADDQFNKLVRDLNRSLAVLAAKRTSPPVAIRFPCMMILTPA